MRMSGPPHQPDTDTAVGAERYRRPTPTIDCDHPAVRAFAEAAAPSSLGSPVQRAVRLFHVVRDRIRYDPYVPFYREAHYRASRTLAQGSGYCVTKAVLLCALGRACGIPARLGFATVRNHLAPPLVVEMMGSNLFVYHGFTEFWLEGRWVKATPAFNRELSLRHGVAPLAFDGRKDAVFPARLADGRPFFEYLEDHGTSADVPLDALLAAWRRTYGDRRVDQWIAAFEAGGSMRPAANGPMPRPRPPT